MFLGTVIAYASVLKSDNSTVQATTNSTNDNGQMITSNESFMSGLGIKSLVNEKI